jgi:predicted nucleic acid-binding protein
VSRLLIDTSVLIKWFHAEGEEELDEARTLRSAHVNGDLDAHMIALAIHEIGNVLLRALNWDPVDVADQLDDLLAIVGPPLISSPAWLRRAATLGYHWSVLIGSCRAPVWPNRQPRPVPACSFQRDSGLARSKAGSEGTSGGAACEQATA